MGSVAKSTGPEAIKLFSCSTQLRNEILNALKYKNVKKFNIFSGLERPRMLFFLLIHVKMPTIVPLFRHCTVIHCDAGVVLLVDH